MFETIINYIDGTKESSKLNINVSGEVTTATLAVKELDYKKIASIDVLLNEDEINAGDGGFFLVPANNRLQDSAIGHFKDHDDLELELLYPKMTVLGINHNNKAYIAFATGMKEIAWHYIKIKDNKYYFYMRFAVRGEELYEDIALRVHTLSGDLSYSAMARSYRGYLLDNGYKTIKERLHPALAYAADTMYVRIRMGWKPVPCTVLEQTKETEPEMHVACTFSDVENLMHEYKKAGIDKAEFCLVGFNKSGHDGRWPQIFPIEERLGGEEGLKKLIKTAHSLGYTVCCHTNSTDGLTADERKALAGTSIFKAGSKKMIVSGGKMNVYDKDTRVTTFEANGTLYIPLKAVEDVLAYGRSKAYYVSSKNRIYVQCFDLADKEKPAGIEKEIKNEQWFCNTLGSSELFVDGKLTYTTAATAIDGVIYIPLTMLADGLGADVQSLGNGAYAVSKTTANVETAKTVLSHLM